MLYFDEAGLEYFQTLLTGYGGKREPKLGGSIMVEVDTRSGKIFAHPGSDIDSALQAPIIPGFPKIKIWVAPDLNLEDRDVFFDFLKVTKNERSTGRTRNWVEVVEVHRSTTKGYVPAWGT